MSSVMQIPYSFQLATENNASTMTAESFDSWLMTQFVCPVDHTPLVRKGNWMINVQNPLRRYPIAHGIPVFLRDDIEHTAWWSRESLAQATRIANGVEEFRELLGTAKWSILMCKVSSIRPVAICTSRAKGNSLSIPYREFASKKGTIPS